MTTIAEIQKQLISTNFDAYIVTRNNLFISQDILDEENKIFELTDQFKKENNNKPYNKAAFDKLYNDIFKEIEGAYSKF